MFNGVVFAVHDAGFLARCALELDDATQNRLDKIFNIVSECRFGIHDLSRTETDENGLPRFNMPLELGIFIACKRFGGSPHRRKACLILDRESYRYQAFISDIAGQDIHEHRNDAREAVKQVRSWLKTASRRTNIPGGAEIWRRYERFSADLPEMCQTVHIEVEELTFIDRVHFMTEWLKLRAP